jgi:hypothetical protein
MVMIRETDRPRRVAMNRRRTVLDYPERPADTHPETLAWIARIEEMRSEEASPRCPTCDSTTPPVTQMRHCSDCDTAKPLEAFARNRTEPLGRGYLCLPCKRIRQRALDARRRLRKLREILGVAS